MKTVWKFPLRVVEEQEVTVPAGAQLLHVEIQGETAQLWALVDPNVSTVNRTVCIYGTGHNMPDNPGRYINTFTAYNGALIFHAFEPTV